MVSGLQNLRVSPAFSWCNTAVILFFLPLHGSFKQELQLIFIVTLTLTPKSNLLELTISKYVKKWLYIKNVWNDRVKFGAAQTEKYTYIILDKTDFLFSGSNRFKRFFYVP